MMDFKSSELNRLMTQIAQGDSRALEKLYRSVSSKLFPLAVRLTKSPELAEEVIQEVFLTIWTKADQFDHTKGQVIVWIVGITRNRCFDIIRAQQRDMRFIDGAVYEGQKQSLSNALDEAVRGADARELKLCLERLAPGPKDAILCVYYEGLTHSELASRTAIPVGTLKSWIRRGLLQLRDCLEP